MLIRNLGSKLSYGLFSSKVKKNLERKKEEKKEGGRV